MATGVAKLVQPCMSQIKIRKTTSHTHFQLCCYDQICYAWAIAKLAKRKSQAKVAEWYTRYLEVVVREIS